MPDLATSDDPTAVLTKIARILNECRLSHAIHARKLKELSSLRSSTSPCSRFSSYFTKALTPLFDFAGRSVSSERPVRFVSAFAGRRDDEASDEFLEEFLRFLLFAARAAHRTTRFRACQIISEIIMRLPDDADVNNEVWDEVIDSMQQRMEDKVPAIRCFAVRALSRFASDGENVDTIKLFIQALSRESNAEVRKTLVLSMPPFNETSTAVVESTLDVNESVRKAAYCVLASKFPLQSLSIKLRTTILHRGLSDRSPSVTKECLKMLKDEWLMKCCGGDPITLLRFLDVETYELVGETVMDSLLKDGILRVQEGPSIRQYLTLSGESEGEQTIDVQLMEAEVSLYWKSLCRHLQTVAQAKGSDAATTTGTEAAVYASEASDSNDLLDGILPATISDYVTLVKAHLSAGPNYRFASRQLLLLGAMLDFSDTSNRKVASSFVHELLLRPLEYEVDDDGEKILIGDGISLGGDRDWSIAVSELAKKVHASLGEFETIVTAVLEELAGPCRERSADFMQWMHCLSVTGLLFENIDSVRSLRGKAIESSEILHSLLLPGAKHVHIAVQRIATRCLSLFGLRERKPSEGLVKQLRLSFINSPALVSIMACKGLVDLVLWQGPQEVDLAIGLDPQESSCDEKKGFTSVSLSDITEDVSVGVLDLMYSGFSKEDCDATSGLDDQETVCAILGEGFAKILLLSESYSSIPSCLRPLILCKLVKLYFSEETNGLQRLKQCLSVFFEHYPTLSQNHKKCISEAFLPVIKSMWPGIYGNPGGSTIMVSRLRKRALQASRFMLQMMQLPLLSDENEEKQSTENAQNCPSSVNSSLEFASGEEGIAIRIGAEVVTFPEKKSAAGKAYILALCKIAVLVQFRPSEQEAIKCMRGLLNSMIAFASSDKEVVKELNQLAARLKSLDKHPDQELPEEQASILFGNLGLDPNLKMETLTVVLPPTPAPPRSTRAVPPRRRAKREASSDEDEEEEAASVPVVPATPGLVSTRSQRASKTVAMSKMTAKTTIEFSDGEISEESDLTAEDTSDEDEDCD